LHNKNRADPAATSLCLFSRRIDVQAAKSRRVCRRLAALQVLHYEHTQHQGGSLSVEQWLVTQLSDSAFPAGGFAHSSGLESAWQQGRVDSQSLDEFTRSQLNQAAHAVVPFVAAAHREPLRFVECDLACGAMLSNHVANRASRAQGQAFLLAGSRIFSSPALIRLAGDVRGERAAGHFAPVFGWVCQELDIKLEPAVRLFLFLTLRSLVSSAVRLGIAGPLEGQSLQWRAAPFAEALVVPASRIAMQEAAQTAPLLDLLQGGHDRLYSRLFQS
jgi:urease accessory protein